MKFDIFIIIIIIIHPAQIPDYYYGAIYKKGNFG